MSITRKDIKAVLPDIDDDAMKSLLTLIHTETDTLKDEKDDLQKQLAKANDDLKAANTAKETAESNLAEFKNQQTAKDTKTAKESAYRKLLAEAGVGEKHMNLILRATNVDALEIGKDGSLKDAAKLSESIKADYADYISTTVKTGANVATPPVGGSSGKYKSKSEIMQIKDTAERQKAIADNHELFGI